MLTIAEMEDVEKFEISYTEPQSAPSDFADLFRAQFPRLAGYCAGLVGDRELGADLAQEALARTWSRWVSVRQPEAYAFLVATNLVRDTWRDRDRRQKALRSLAATPVGDVAAPDRSLRDLVERLPERLRVPTLLHYYADLPAEHVARIMHRPAGSVRQRLHEARRLLAADLKES